MKTRFVLMVAVAALLLTGAAVQAQMAKPNMVTVTGKIADLTCAAKGRVMMDSWRNAESDDHMSPDGPKPGCATMCLKSGQPAALYADEELKAVLACNPKWTLADYAAKDVELQGFWAGSKKDAARSFVPAKIRTVGGGDWVAVDCATMHG